MKHRVGFNRLGRKPAHRKALHRNMVTSLFKYERIRTTKAKAREIRRTAEKMITRAKIDSVHNRRMVGRDIKDKAILAKLFVDIAPRFKTRPGGYTRLLKVGHRAGDASEMVLLELVKEEVEEGRKKQGTKSSAKAAPKPKPKAKKAKTAAADEGAAADVAEAESAVTPEEPAKESATDDEPEADTTSETDEAKS